MASLHFYITYNLASIFVSTDYKYCHSVRSDVMTPGVLSHLSTHNVWVGEVSRFASEFTQTSHVCQIIHSVSPTGRVYKMVMITYKAWRFITLSKCQGVDSGMTSSSPSVLTQCVPTIACGDWWAWPCLAEPLGRVSALSLSRIITHPKRFPFTLCHERALDRKQHRDQCQQVAKEILANLGEWQN